MLVALFAAEVFAAATKRPTALITGREGTRHRAAVMIPAHNESTGLLQTLSDIKPQLRPGDRLLVIADNCTDDTAALARTAGAEVVERHDPENVGKGYALDFGICHLARDPPEVVVMIDADCRLEIGAISHLVVASATRGRPAQGLYLIKQSVGSPIDHRVAEFAFKLKNWVRPLGREALRWPCQLAGSCMAFPWDTIRSVDLATGQLVEDVTLGLHLTRGGYPPFFLPCAAATSSFPLTKVGTRTQRQRWEHGHIAVIMKTIPKFILEAIVERNWPLLQLALDLAIPPLTMFGLLLIGSLAVTALGLLVGTSPLPLLINASSILIFACAVSSAWWLYGRDIVPARAIFSLGFYLVNKIPLYTRALARSPTLRWIRTDRRKDDTLP